MTQLNTEPGVRRGRLSQEEFVLAAIDAGRGKGRGISAKSSGFEHAFASYFPKSDATKAVGRLAKAGVIAIRGENGSTKLYRPDNVPAPSPVERGKLMLEQIKAARN